MPLKTARPNSQFRIRMSAELRSANAWKGLPDPVVVGRARGVRMLASFALDPVGALDRHFMPLGRAIEITRIGRSPRRLLFMYDPEYNRRFLLNSKAMRTSGLWPLRSPPNTAQRSLSYHPLKAYGAE